MNHYETHSQTFWVSCPDSSPSFYTSVLPGCQLQLLNNCMSKTGRGLFFADQAKLLSTDHVKMYERDMAGTALQECRYELPCFLHLKGISVALWK